MLNKYFTSLRLGSSYTSRYHVGYEAHSNHRLVIITFRKDLKTDPDLGSILL